MLDFLESLPYKTYVGVAVCSLFASYWLVPRLVWLARGLGMFMRSRRPDEDIPAMGGLAVGLPFLTGYSLLLLLENQVSQNLYVVPLQTRGLFFGTVAALTIGLLHDLLGLHRVLRLGLQCALGGLAYHYEFRLLGANAGPAVALPITILWVLGLINLLDIVNRHTKALAQALLIAALALLAAAFIQDQYRMIVACCFVGGTLFGLLSHAPEQQPNLGSSGTYLLGYVLAVAALQSNLLDATPGAVLVAAIVVLLLPLILPRRHGPRLLARLEPERLRRQRTLRLHAEAFALDISAADSSDDAWTLLCRAADEFGYPSLAHRTNDGSLQRSWDADPVDPVRVPLTTTGGYVEVAVPAGTDDIGLPAFRRLVETYDDHLAAQNLEAFAARSAGMRVLLINRYYADMSATGQIVHELADDLAQRGASVTVLTGALRYENGELVPGRSEFTPTGVCVIRIPPTHFGRTSTLNRAMDHAFFYASTMWWLLRSSRRQFTHVLALTDPPLIALVAAMARRRKGWKLVYGVQDLYPETAHALGILRDGPLYRLLRALNIRALRKADAVVAVSRTMARRIEDLAPTGVVSVIPNWTDSRKIITPKRTAADRPFRVIYTGNMGLAQQIDTVLELLGRFSGRADVEFLFVGGGARRHDIAAAARDNGNVRLHDYVSKDRLSHYLADSDLGLVSLSPVLEGLALPTKTYTYLAAGLPLLTFGARHSDFEELIVPGWGRHFSPEELPAAIDYLEDEIRLGPGRAPMEQIRAHYEAKLDRSVRTSSYYGLLESLDDAQAVSRDRAISAAVRSQEN